jgi:hypothetical protein
MVLISQASFVLVENKLERLTWHCLPYPFICDREVLLKGKAQYS